MEISSEFVFATCQMGAEAALRNELGRSHPELRLAFSRPGFVTFKVGGGNRAGPGFRLRSVFARRWGLSLGRIQGDRQSSDWASRVWQAVPQQVGDVHVWSRDTRPAEPLEGDAIWPEEVGEVEATLRQTAGERVAGGTSGGVGQSSTARWVLDCILVDPGEYWFGCHRTTRDPTTHWPGARPPLVLPEHAVSRAYLKMEEALRWSGFPVPPGARWAELGSAPGGAAQALLDRGYEVLGVDPAEMHPDVLACPRFRHVRRRIPQVRRREFRKIRWLAADMNVAPRYTLDAVEAIVTHPETRIRGLILVLKLADWALADEIPQYLQRIAGWNFQIVRARQLWHNRQEICVAAQRRRAR